ncbi:MAG: hypothetical protein M1814_004169 [Vezdaea aestivalis]|nr:MAG: hypothetical protein M1814_004169 [Vezdaea aestivalis]
MNGLRNNIMEGGTINPAALNSPGTSALSAAPSAPVAVPTVSDTSPRGVKRSRSPDSYADNQGDFGEGTEDQKRRKRGRPPKATAAVGNVPESPNLSSPQSSNQSHLPAVQTPHLQAQTVSHPTPVATPTQASPSKPAAKSTIKALPTVRDHTTDQLGPDEDEYIPRETDPDGDRKIAADGGALGGRTFKCRTFFVPGRGQKYFMLATECARVLSYRDSYLLFNKNRSLYKIIATQAEKDNLIQQDILPYSYRSRQIAIVTAKSMFRQFGSRMIQNGRRVRDDYWETKARKQGFTEDDLAGEKRPGAAKAKEAAAEAASASAALLDQHPSIVYSNGPLGHDTPVVGLGIPPHMGQYPMPHLTPHENRARDYGHIARPKQDISGTPYVDLTKSTSANEIKTAAAQAAEFNKILTQQSSHRANVTKELWTRETPSTPIQQPSIEHSATLGQPHQSPRPGSSGPLPGLPQPMMGHPPLPPHPPQHMIPQSSLPPHSQQIPAQQQTPMPRGISQGAGVRSDPNQHRSSGPGVASGPGGPASSPYNYPQQGQLWPSVQQPQQSPLSQSHQMAPYNQVPPLAQGPQHQQSQPPHSQPPHSQQTSHPPPMQHQQAPQQMHPHPGTLQYPGMGGVPQGYGTPNRSYYNPAQQHPQQQQYMHQSSGAPQPGMQGWAPPPHGSHGQNQWSGWPGNN